MQRARPAARRHRRCAASVTAPCASADWRAIARPADPCGLLRCFSVDHPFSLELPCRPSPRRRRRPTSLLFRDSQHCGTAMSQKSYPAKAFTEALRLALRLPVRYGRSPAISGCGSSVVEHSLGKGEVESSILSRSTSFQHPCCRTFVLCICEGEAATWERRGRRAGGPHQPCIAPENGCHRQLQPKRVLGSDTIR